MKSGSIGGVRRVPPMPSVALHAETLRSGAPADGRSARCRRIALAMFVIVVAGLGDLMCTLSYARAVGLIEANPLARLAVSIGGEPMLVALKAVSIGACCAALFIGRRNRRVEIAAWICAGAMAALMAYWNHYNDQIAGLGNEVASLAARSGASPECADTARWLTLAD